MFCMYCGEEIEDDSVFCIECGRRVDEDEDEALGGQGLEPAETVSHDADPKPATPAKTVVEEERKMEPAATPPMAPSAANAIPAPNEMPMQAYPAEQMPAPAADSKAVYVKVSRPLIIVLVVAVLVIVSVVAFSFGILANPQTESGNSSSATSISPAASTSSAQSAQPEATTSQEADTTSNQGAVGATASPSTSATSGGYILPDSSTRAYSRSELEGYDSHTLRLARNEVYARHGRMFKDAELQQYFNSKSWYTPTIPADNFTDSMLSTIERDNVYLIRDIEQSR